MTLCEAFECADARYKQLETESAEDVRDLVTCLLKMLYVNDEELGPDIMYEATGSVSILPPYCRAQSVQLLPVIRKELCRRIDAEGLHGQVDVWEVQCIGNLLHNNEPQFLVQLLDKRRRSATQDKSTAESSATQDTPSHCVAHNEAARVPSP